MHACKGAIHVWIQHLLTLVDPIFRPAGAAHAINIHAWMYEDRCEIAVVLHHGYPLSPPARAHAAQLLAVREPIWRLIRMQIHGF